MSASASRNSWLNSIRLNCERVMDQNPANYITVEIYNQTYHLSGQDADHIRKLAALNLADDLSQNQEGPSGLAARVGHARAASLRGLLDEVLEEERKTGS